MKKFYLNGCGYYLHEDHNSYTARQLFTAARLAKTSDTLEIAEDQDSIEVSDLKFDEIAYVNGEGGVSFVHYKRGN